MALSALGNIAEFIEGFATKRGQIEEANKQDKQYKLQTIQTLFTFAEGKRAQADAAQALAQDASLSPAEQDRHAAEAERHRDEGQRIYEGASELFGLIDEKPKTGKKENPAMQFLQFVNPFKRRGPQPGQFEQDLSDLLAGLGGAKTATTAAGSPGFAEGGVARQTPTGQGAPAPESPTATALGAAIPGVGPTPRLAAGPVSPAAATLAQQIQAPIGTATAEAMEVGAAPPVTGIAPTPARPLLDQRVLTASDLYPHITGTRAQFRDLNLAQYAERVNQEGQSALANMNAYLQGKAVEAEQRGSAYRPTLDEALMDPAFSKHYRAASRAFQNLEQHDIFQTEIGNIFPEMRAQPPEAGSRLAADVARQFRLEQRAGKFGDAATWSAATIAAVEAFDLWASLQPDLSPEMGALRRYIAVTRKDPDLRTEQDQRDVDQFVDLYDRGIYGVGPAAGAGRRPNYQFPRGIGPDGREIYFVVDPTNPQAGAVPLRDTAGQVVTTEGPLQLEDIMYVAEYYLDPVTNTMSPRVERVDTKKVIAALQRPGTRRQIEDWMATVIFDDQATQEVQDYLNAYPEAGLAPGEEARQVPTPGGAALEAFRRRAAEREGRRTGEGYVPPPSPFD